MESMPLLDCAGRRRSPATSASFHLGQPPRNKGMSYPADPPTVEEINAVMRAAVTVPTWDRQHRNHPGRPPERCGSTRHRMLEPVVDGPVGNTTSLVGYDSNGDSELGGLFLRDYRPFNVVLPPKIGPLPHAPYLTSKHLYLLDGHGSLWQAPSPSPPHRRTTRVSEALGLLRLEPKPENRFRLDRISTAAALALAS